MEASMSMNPVTVPDREWIRKHIISATLVVTLAISALFHWAARSAGTEAVAVLGGIVATEQAIAQVPHDVLRDVKR
jgi:hypothetical protein